MVRAAPTGELGVALRATTATSATAAHRLIRKRKRRSACDRTLYLRVIPAYARALELPFITHLQEARLGADWLWWWIDDDGEAFGMLGR